MIRFSGETLSSEPFSCGLTLNVEYFKSYKHIEYSVGAIYLTVMNLPHKIRYKQENVILVGLIPGPKEPSLNILRLLVDDELLEFWEGVSMITDGNHNW